MSREFLTGIKARIGSIAPTVMMSLPKSVQRLLEQDIPDLLDEIRDLKYANTVLEVALYKLAVSPKNDTVREESI